MPGTGGSLQRGRIDDDRCPARAQRPPCQARSTGMPRATDPPWSASSSAPPRGRSRLHPARRAQGPSVRVDSHPGRRAALADTGLPGAGFGAGAPMGARGAASLKALCAHRKGSGKPWRMRTKCGSPAGVRNRPVAGSSGFGRR